MSKPQYLKSKSITAMLIAVVGMFIPSSLFAQSTSTYSEYAAKFLCGMNQSTDISVHNPNLFTTDNPLSFLKKAVLSLSEGTTPVPPSAFKQDTLANDYAEKITCGTIRSLLGSAAPPAPAFIEGYVVIIVPPASNPNEFRCYGCLYRRQQTGHGGSDCSGLGPQNYAATRGSGGRNEATIRGINQQLLGPTTLGS